MAATPHGTENMSSPRIALIAFTLLALYACDHPPTEQDVVSTPVKRIVATPNKPDFLTIPPLPESPTFVDAVPRSEPALTARAIQDSPLPAKRTPVPVVQKPQDRRSVATLTEEPAAATTAILATGQTRTDGELIDTTAVAVGSAVPEQSATPVVTPDPPVNVQRALPATQVNIADG
jgi:hypothetical protein